MSTDPETIWNAAEAADIAILAMHSRGEARIVVVGVDGKVALDLDRGLGVALAARLNELAQQMQEPRTIRRHPDMDDCLREVDN
jgi:hypothetical protein